MGVTCADVNDEALFALLPERLKSFNDAVHCRAAWQTPMGLAKSKRKRRHE